MSVLLPFYNAESSLDRAIKSIIDQSFKDWELILVDNASTDGSRNLAEIWLKQDKQVQLIECNEPGIAHALNKGLNLAGGEYIARMDADDMSHSTRLEKQQHFLQKNPEIGVISCQSDFQSNLERAEGFEHFVSWQNSIITPHQHWINRFKESPIAHPTVMFRKALTDQFGDYSTDPFPEDYELWLRWMEAGVHFAKLPEQLFMWNDSPDRLSRTHPNYSKEAFFKVKGHYLSRWMIQNVASNKKVVACGTSRECRQRLAWLMDQGVRIDYLTDVVHRSPHQFAFMPLELISSPDEYFVINLINKRDVSPRVAHLFVSLGFLPGRDFFLLA